MSGDLRPALLDDAMTKASPRDDGVEVVLAHATDIAFGVWVQAARDGIVVGCAAMHEETDDPAVAIALVAQLLRGERTVLGYDGAGIVRAVGSAVELFGVGDEVYYAGAIDRPGSNSEFQLVDERIVGLKPANLDFADAAALPLTTVTAWEALFDRLGIDLEGSHNGKSLLIIGGAGGVGTILVAAVWFRLFPSLAQRDRLVKLEN